MKLTSKEMEVMDVLWAKGAPMTVSEILTVSNNRTWKENSIFVMMKRLEDKGAVIMDHLRPTVTNNARTYRPLFSYEEYLAKNVASVNEKRSPGLDFDVDLFIKSLKKEIR